MPTITPVSFASHKIRQQKPVAFTAKDPADAFVNQGWKDYDGKPVKIGKKGGLGKVIKLGLLAAVAVGVALHLVPADKLAKLPFGKDIALKGKDLVAKLVTSVKNMIPGLKQKAKDVAATVQETAGNLVDKAKQVVSGAGTEAAKVVEEVAPKV